LDKIKSVNDNDEKILEENIHTKKRRKKRKKKKKTAGLEEVEPINDTDERILKENTKWKKNSETEEILEEAKSVNDNDEKMLEGKENSPHKRVRTQNRLLYNKNYLTDDFGKQGVREKL
jgi:hypothetical protein